MKKRKQLVKRIFTAVLSCAMACSVFAETCLTSYATETTASINYQTVLGASEKYGILASTLEQTNHMQTNYAVKKFIRNGEQVCEPDLINGTTIPFIAAELDNGARFGNSCYASDATTVTYQYVTGSETASDAIKCDNASIQLAVDRSSTKAAVEAKVSDMITYMKNQSAALAAKTADITIEDSMISDLNHHTIDLTGYDADAAVVINVPAGSALQSVIEKDTGLILKKKAGQVVILNILADTVKIGKTQLEISDDGVSMTTVGDMGKGSEQNTKLLKYATKNLIWNFPNATSVELNSVAGTFLFPKDTADVRITATSSGWLQSAGKAMNESCEWHFPYEMTSTTPVTPVVSGAEATFSKTAVGSTAELADASLTLTGSVSLETVTRKSGPAITLSADKKTISWTSGTEALVLSKLPDGTYTMTETAAPTGYDVATAIEFKIISSKLYKADGTTLITDSKITMEDAPTTTPAVTGAEGTFSKTAVGSTTELADASLTLTGSVSLETVTRKSGPAITLSADKKTISWTSGTEALVLSKLPDGTYTMTETAAPTGYDVATAIEFKIISSKLYKADGTTLITDSKITMEDAPTTTPAVTGAEGTFSKTAVGSTTELADASLTLTGSVSLETVTKKSGPAITLSADKKTISWTSGTEALVLSKLPDGTYSMTETAAPTGYIAAPTIEFKVIGGKLYKADGITLITGSKIAMEDPTAAVPGPGIGKFQKKSTDGDLAGARIKITTTDPSIDLSTGVVKAAASGGENFTFAVNSIEWLTTTNMVVLENLPNGVYTMHEEAAPTGYQIAADITFRMVNGYMYDMAGNRIEMISMTDAKFTDPSHSSGGSSSTSTSTAASAQSVTKVSSQDTAAQAQSAKQLAKTGGFLGTAMAYMLGIILILAGTAIVFVSRKKQEK